MFLRFFKSSRPLIIIIFLSFLFFLDTSKFFFISDDFYYLSFTNYSSIILPSHLPQHYIPLFLSLLLTVKKIFGLNPSIFHLLTISVHLLNSILVFMLAKNFFKGNLPLLSAAVFTFFFPSYETVYWITGLSLSLMLMFSLLSMLVFIYWLKTKKIYHLFLVNLLTFASILSHEYGLMTAVVFFLYLKIFKKNAKLNDYFSLLLAPLLITCFLTFGKLIARTALTAQNINPYSFTATFIKTFTYLILPFPFLLDKVDKILIITIFILLFFIIYKKISGQKLRLFLLLWLLADLLMISLTSLPQARYYYFLAVPAIFLLLSILSSISDKLLIFYCLLVIFQGLVFLSEQKVYWSKTSLITKNVLNSLSQYYKNLPDDKNLYLVNFPDSLNGPPWNAYLFRNGLGSALELFNGLDPQKLVFVTTSHNPLLRYDPILTEGQLIKLEGNGNRIVYFNQVFP
ncbi:hypothetical protein A2W14_00830 [Candidatus Gottesmanbacteria bacterium RBG_16_37_8]|uniref:Glycosyltransferase RgtA/B/C/D-like domain-containing protein n=1 Tax=Candidatus Gottesmanbacteria bacterium RBG_16_37_8 TaxID=1798371 RepID=A0A1F5YVC4_9BACT|nr:MAG: hypothetical protein A2W14_00830 [Candidatus Gottesmanbacteria bacterium RBG_16_37_8]